VKPKLNRVLVVVFSLVAVVVMFASRFRILVSPYQYMQAELRALEVFPYDDWESVITHHVGAEGRVDYPQLLLNREALDRFVALIGFVGPFSRPDLFRSETQQRDYYVRSYNALVLFSRLDAWPEGPPEESDSRFFYRTRFVIDGRKANLYELEHQFLRKEFADLFQTAAEDAQRWNWSLVASSASAD
jgi:hypothetical protein